MKPRKELALALALGAAAVLAATELPAFWKPELMGTRIVRAEDLRTVDGEEGRMQVYFQAPTSTLLNLGLRRMTIDPGMSPHPARPYSQPIESLLVVEDGVLEVQLDEEDPTIERLEAGAALFLAPNQWHKLRNAGDVPVTFLEMIWTSPGMNGEPDYPENTINWRRPGRE